jgi:glycosyltransferase involved in cell wall biosynthesis
MKRPLRIGIEAQRLFRPQKHGMDIYALELIRALQVLDTYNEYYILVQPGQDNTCIKETSNFHIIQDSSFFYPSWEQWTLPNLVKSLKLDLVHFTANTASLFGVDNAIITIHDVIYLQQNKHTKGQNGSAYQRFGNLYRKWLVPFVAKKAKKVITVSNCQKKEIKEELHIRDNKIHVIHNGLSPVYLQASSVEEEIAVRRKFELPERYFFYLGNTEPRKNLKGVLRAYKIALDTLSDCPALVIKGLKPEYLQEKLKELGLQMLSSHIKLIPYVETRELAILYKLSDCFLFPSFTEGFGIPIIEAMACGTPVITSNTTSMPEVSGGASLLINPAEHTELAHAMMSVINDKELSQQLVAAGKERANHFSWINAAAETKAIYEAAVHAQSISVPKLHKPVLAS